MLHSLCFAASAVRVGVHYGDGSGLKSRLTALKCPALSPDKARLSCVKRS